MPDLFHVFGADLATGATGGLALAREPEFTRQRVVRRLLTNPGDYIWQPDYGAGLGRFVGQGQMPLRVAAIVRRQLALEAGVAQAPPPQIAVVGQPDGSLFLSITYGDAVTGLPQTISHTVS